MARQRGWRTWVGSVLTGGWLAAALCGALGCAGADDATAPDTGSPGRDQAAPDVPTAPDAAPDADPTDLRPDAGPADAAAPPDTAGDGAAGGDTAELPGDGGPRDTAADARDTAGDAADAAAEVDAGPPRVEAPLGASEAFRARQAAYLDACYAASAPPAGGLYGQVCRVKRGGPTLNEAAIEAAFAKLAARQDTADFAAAALVRLLYLDDENPTLAPELRARLEDTLLGFKYWLSEPGRDKMCYWSENHQILFHSSELLVGQHFPDTPFQNDGLTGAEHVAHALPRVLTWLERRGRLGFSEWHSNVYFNEDIPALVNLADFAADPGVREKARMVLDILAFDFANNVYKGLFATVHGRTYPNKLVGGLDDSTADAAWLMTGLGAADETANFSGAFLATSAGYFPPPLIEAVAAAAAASHEHRQRDGLDIADGPAWGISYTAPDDIVFWAGMVALAAPEIIQGTCDLLDTYDLWEAFLFGDLPAELRGLLQGMAGTPTLIRVAEEASAVSRGIALQGMDTYTYRTPDYQLSGAQGGLPGYFGAQTHLWQATLDRQAYVFTSLPSDIHVDTGDDVSLAGEWTGSWMPALGLYKNVGLIRYPAIAVPQLVAAYITPAFTHAYFPRAGFDEVVQTGPWTFGRKGEAYLGLYSEVPTFWAEASDAALETNVSANTWIVELGSAAENGAFETFMAGLTAAAVTVGETLTYDSPSRGLIELDPAGALVVAGEPVAPRPYPRWQNAFADVPAGSAVTRIRHEGAVLELDFAAGTRRLWVPAGR